MVSPSERAGPRRPPADGGLAGPVRPRTAVVLAAGEGRRLAAMGTPKPLVPLLGRRLIERVLEALVRAGVEDVLVVLGDRAGPTRAGIAEAARRVGATARFVVAERWAKGNGASALAAARHLGETERFYLVMADHVLDPEILRRLAAEPMDGAAVLVAVDPSPGPHVDLDDATKVLLADGRVRRVGKGLERWDGIDTGAFLCTPALFDGLAAAAAGGRYALSDGIDELAREGRVRPVRVEGLLWQDVDTPESMRALEDRLRLELAKPGEDGLVARWLNRPLSTRLSVWLARSSVTPNEISVAAFGLSLLGAALLALGDALACALGGLVVQISSIVDGCDGEVARLKGLATPRGGWLDTMLDRYADLAIVVGATWGFAPSAVEPWPWLGALVAITGFHLASYVTKEYELRYGEPYPMDGLCRLKRRDVRLFAVLLGGLVGRPYEAVLVLGVLSHALVAAILLRGSGAPAEPLVPEIGVRGELDGVDVVGEPS